MKELELSKELSYVLRHNPKKYELEMDEDGWVSIKQIFYALQKTEEWKQICIEDIINVVEQSEKKRHELKNGKIRALYGHSISMKIIKEEKMPPNILYHGTSEKFLSSILKNGILPQKRQYVHLSQDIEMAEIVGKRYDMQPCILIIDAKRAWSEGIKFYYGNEQVWLADKIPSKYIMMFN